MLNEKSVSTPRRKLLSWATQIRYYNQRRMVKTWLLRLELARDDDGSLSDEGIDALTTLLAKDGAKPVVSRGESGTVLVQVTLDAKTDRAARSTAEQILRYGANKVWLALGLPPFTIAFLDATEVARQVE